MATFHDMVFGPLTQKYCQLYYWFMVFWAVMFVFVVAGMIMAFLRRPRGISLRHVLSALMSILNVFIIYLINRLMYSMCVRSL